MSNRFGQRGWNRQPDGGATMSGGDPGMPVSRFFAPGQRRERVHQALGVGVQRIVEELPRRRHLHDLAGVHDGDAVGELDQQRQIVGDEQDREPELLLQLARSAA